MKTEKLIKMNIKFKIDNIVKDIGTSTLRIYKITGRSDTGYYMENIVTGTPLGTDPNDNRLILATVEEVLKAHFYEENMFDTDRIYECIKAYKAQADFDIQWNNKIDDYPPQIITTTVLDFVSFATDWNKSHK